LRKATIKQALEDGAGTYYVIWIHPEKKSQIHIAWGRQRMTTPKATSLENYAKEKVLGQNACQATFSGGKRRQTKPVHLYREFKDETTAKKYFDERVAKKRRLGYRGCKLDFARKDLSVPISGIIMDG
jgi:predicted DNA-binding WGR domain protein